MNVETFCSDFILSQLRFNVYFCFARDVIVFCYFESGMCMMNNSTFHWITTDSLNLIFTAFAGTTAH